MIIIALRMKFLNVYSYNGTTFVGAHGELPNLRETTCIRNTSIKAFGI
jgi:hypothetical protein